MQEMREEHTNIAERHRGRYSAQGEAQKKRKEAEEMRGMSSDIFKNQVLHESLGTVQQDAANFHVFTTAFCAMANKPSPPPIILPEILPVPDACINLLPDDPTESAVTGKSENSNNNSKAENDRAQEKENFLVE